MELYLSLDVLKKEKGPTHRVGPLGDERNVSFG
jgi:hypothetical protein